MKNMPNDTSVKFDPQGNPLPYYGNTIVSFFNNPKSTIFQEALAAQEKIRTSCVSKNLTYLPPASFHATILSLCREIDRNGEYWPRDLARDLPFTEIDRILKQRFETVPAFTGVQMKIKSLDEQHILLETASAKDEKSVRNYRDLVAETVGIRHWWHDTFVFHITWAYKIHPITDEQQKEIQPLLEKLTEQAQKKVGTILLPPGEFVIFNDMMAYSNDLRKRGTKF